MSIERAIERIDKLFVPEYDPEYFQGLFDALKILREEAEPPCERCKHWKYYIKEKAHCTIGWDYDDLVCKFHEGLKDYFEPKEKQ